MSHVTKIALKITDLDALEAALKRIGGLELRRGQNTYEWYSGKGVCDHAIVQTKKLALNYEIGLKKAEDGSYELMWDPYDTRLLNAVGGLDARGLRREYAASVATRQFYTQGYQVSRSITAKGEIVLEASR